MDQTLSPPWERPLQVATVYMSIMPLSDYHHGFGYTVGPNFSNLILTLNSEDVSSQCIGNGINTRLKYVDLNWPVPASAYKCQDQCGYSHVGDTTPTECSIVWSDVNSLLGIPSMVTDLDSAFKTCTLDSGYLANFWFDPPIALQRQQNAAEPTLPAASKSTPAAPSSLPAFPMPQNTNCL